MGAVAAVAVVGLVVVAGGITIAGPAGATAVATEAALQQTPSEAATSPEAMPDLVAAVGDSAAAIDGPAIAADTARIEEVADREVSPVGTPEPAEIVAEAEEAGTAPPLQLPERLKTSLPAIAGAPYETPPKPPTAADAARMEAADAAPTGPDRDTPRLAFSETAVATDIDTAPPIPEDPPATRVASVDPNRVETAAPAAVQPEDAETDDASATRIVAGQGVNVRLGPGKSNATLFALKGGAEVTLTGEAKRGWQQIKAADGRTGWVYGDYLKHG
jgi:hypothetical protein